MLRSQGLARMRRQTPSSVPVTIDLWLVSTTKVPEGLNDQKSSRVRLGFELVTTGQLPDGAFGQPPCCSYSFGSERDRR